MRLSVFLPNRVLVDEQVTKVSAEGLHGAFTLLPRHLDFAVVLVPGLLIYAAAGGGESYVAVDGGVMTKVGDEVRVSTLAAVRSDRLEDLERTVREEFRRLTERERSARLAQARIESRVMQEMFEFEEAL